jgi:hypothetical protein
MTKQPEALRLADALECAAFLHLVERDMIAAELRRLHEVNLNLIELAESLNAALTEVCSANPNLEISCEHDERIKSASAKLKESKHD